MFQKLLRVRYITSKNSFSCLSTNNFNHLQTHSVSVGFNDNQIVCMSVDPVRGSLDDESLGVNSLYAKALGIEENSLVTVSEIPIPTTIQRVAITAVDKNDHYVLETLANDVQSTLLQQIRILSNGQRFPIWIGNTIYVTVTVCDIAPISPGILDNLTEVEIIPPNEDVKYSSDSKNDKDSSSQNTENNNSNKETPSNIFAEYKDKDMNMILRLVPFKDFLNIIGELSHEFSVFVSRNRFVTSLQDTIESPHVYSMKLLHDDSQLEDKILHVRLYIIEDFQSDFKLSPICSENILVSDLILDFFSCEFGSRVILEPYHESLPEIKEIEIYCKRNFSINAKEVFQQYLADSCKSQNFVLNPNIVLQVSNTLRCLLKFQPYQAKFCLINPDFVRNCKLVVVNESLPLKEVLEKNEFCMDKYTTAVANYQDIIDKSLFLFVYNTKVYSKMYNVLITGKAGTGKSTLLAIIKEWLSSYPNFVYTKQINCKSIKGKTVESLHKFFTTILFTLIHRQPSVLILDDLHVLCENINENDALPQNAVYFNRVSEMLEGLFQSFCEHNAVGILASVSSTLKLNKNIYATRGNHLFKNVYSIDDLDKNARKIALEFLFRDCDISNINLDRLAEKTESFVIQDIADFANKTLFESYREDHDQNLIRIAQKHCDTALETVTLTSLEGVSLHSPGDKDLDDIGGLAEVKNILIETMLWPSKYPQLFENAPLRLPSGLLLYGPPGTGKTILAGAAAKHCGLRLISIKGPELLSKYIGASEQAVRDVFLRAQSARPCVLFFDEFDSLAPRRGHDNTGVTDRVVNQLLTQLDGIESLSGVFVLAATSRPDLLDPALLRPGRLDRHIRCNLPDEISRLEILQVLSKSLKLSPDVDLERVARASSGFSGADLQAVLYSAQLESVKDISLEDEGYVEIEKEIDQKQLIEALNHTRPSLTKAEQDKYNKIYKNFEGNSDSKEMKPGSRLTLA